MNRYALGWGLLALAVLVLWLRRDNERGALGRASVAATPQARAETPLAGVPRPESSARAVLPAEAARTKTSQETAPAPRPQASHALLLHVRERGSGIELGSVQLAETFGIPDIFRVHPGSAAAHVLELGPSPIEIPAPERDLGGKRTLHVRAPGYAWARFEFDPTVGGESTVLLEPACTLELEIVGEVSDPVACLRVFGSFYLPLYEGPLRTSTITDLPPGTPKVRAQIGEFANASLTLVEAEVALTAGQITHVKLTLAEDEVPPEVPLAGTLIVPLEWGLESFEFRLELLGTARLEREGAFAFASSEMRSPAPGCFRFELPAVQAGRYLASVDKVGHRQALEVGAAGLTDALVVVPPPAPLLVRCFDAESGLPLGAQGAVSWSGEIIQGQRNVERRPARWDAERQGWVASVPLGSVRLTASSPGYLLSRATVETVAGGSEARLELRRSCDLRLVLREGATDVAWPGDLQPKLTPAEGQADLLSGSSSGVAKVLHKQEPGLYTLSLAEIPGYEPVPDALVELSRSVVTEHVIELVRRP